MVVDGFLHGVDVPLLISTMLRIIRSSHKELESNRVIISVEISLTVKKINSVKTVISPAFTNFKIRSEFSNNLSPWVAMVDHLDSVFVFLGLGFS